jgi:DNA-binding transcriptional LysR family regulator
MQWNLEQLRLFVSVAEQRSFSAVARDQRKAQSAVSSAIALLEEDLGVSLFDRSSGRQPKLTEAGRPCWKRRVKCCASASASMAGRWR